jgi:hypothetical protein
VKKLTLSYIKDEKQNSETRLISFIGNTIRFDLAIIQSPLFHPDLLVIDLNTNKYSKIQLDTLLEPNYVEHTFQYNEMEADDIKKYLSPIIAAYK